MTDVKLSVNGTQYNGWKTASVTRGIESIAGTFSLSVSDRWNGQKTPWPIMEEDQCVLSLGNTVVITGYVDKRSISFDANEHSLTVSGRDAAGMLVDCSAVLSSWQFKNMPLLTLAQKLAGAFDVEVSQDASVTGAAVTLATGKQTGAGKGTGTAGTLKGYGIPKPPKKFSVDPGETAFQVLDRACRMAGVLPISDGRGGIILTRAGSSHADTQLVEGQNILRASVDYDRSERFYTYDVHAQHQGSDNWGGSTVVQIKGSATDAEVRRTGRYLLIKPESSATPEGAKVRAAWEAKVRASRGTTVSITVQGWTQASGLLWPVNALVTVDSPSLGIKGDLLITQAEHSVSDTNGTTTVLTLRRPDAYVPEPTIAAGGQGTWEELRKGV